MDCVMYLVPPMLCHYIITDPSRVDMTMNSRSDSASPRATALDVLHVAVLSANLACCNALSLSNRGFGSQVAGVLAYLLLC